MLEYIFRFFEHFLKTDRNNVKYFGLYDEQVFTANKDIPFYPAVMIDISINAPMQQFARKLQRGTAVVTIYSAVEVVGDFNSADKMLKKNLELMKLNDENWRRIESVNSGVFINQLIETDKELRAFDKLGIDEPIDYFIHNVHRLATETINMSVGNKMVKVAVTQVQFMINDFSAMDREYIYEYLTHELNVTLNNFKNNNNE